LWFDLQASEKLETRAAEVLTNYFREREREDEDNFEPPERLSLTGKAWVTPLELDDIDPHQEPPEEVDNRLAALGQQAIQDGESELARVGRCLDRL
jgi:hypothetical protein